MTARATLFIAVAVALVAVLGWIAIGAMRRARRSSYGNWEQLLGRLTAVDRGTLAEVALDLIDETGAIRTDPGRSALEPERVWKLVGGMDGLEVLEANCTVLIDMAFYLQRWYPESLAVAEELRRGARELEWHVGRLKAARTTGKLESAIGMYAQQAVAVYYRMTRQLLALYATAQPAMLAELERSL